jgi:hypothetical protein
MRMPSDRRDAMRHPLSKSCFVFAFAAMVLALAATVGSAAETRRPNVVLIMSDDHVGSRRGASGRRA